MTESPLRRWLASIRTRLLLTVVLALVLGIGGTALVSRQVLLAGVDDRIHEELSQEAEELRLFARTGLDPETGEDFGDDARRMLTVFLERTIPSEGEVMVTYVDGEPSRRTAQRVPYRVDTDPRLTQRWGSTTETDRGTVDTPAGPFLYLAVPVVSSDGSPIVFVVGQFRREVAGEVARAAGVMAWVGLGSLVVGLVLAAGLARRILTPLGEVTHAAREITESDLSRRLHVGGHDEVSQLAATFNAMLDRLEAAFAQQRQFVDDAGHELRTPITVIRGHLELLDHADPEEREATVALVLDELDRMHRIVEDLLTLAKAEQPDFATPAPLDLDDLTVTVSRKAAALSDAHDWHLDHVGVGRIEADAQRLTQALVQLADNAVKHTPAGTTIAIGSAVDDHEVRLWVRDEGPGIPTDDLERIFERFARGTGGPRRSEGAGLGLAIVRAITEAHGGHVDVASTPGEGSQFTLHIPATVADESDHLLPPDATQPLDVPARPA